MKEMIRLTEEQVDLMKELMEEDLDSVEGNEEQIVVELKTESEGREFYEFNEDGTAFRVLGQSGVYNEYQVLF
jgi:hypothetical protein